MTEFNINTISNETWEELYKTLDEHLQDSLDFNRNPLLPLALAWRRHCAVDNITHKESVIRYLICLYGDSDSIAYFKLLKVAQISSVLPENNQNFSSILMRGRIISTIGNLLQAIGTWIQNKFSKGNRYEQKSKGEASTFTDYLAYCSRQTALALESNKIFKFSEDTLTSKLGTLSQIKQLASKENLIVITVPTSAPATPHVHVLPVDDLVLAQPQVMPQTMGQTAEAGVASEVASSESSVPVTPAEPATAGATLESASTSAQVPPPAAAAAASSEINEFDRAGTMTVLQGSSPQTLEESRRYLLDGMRSSFEKKIQTDLQKLQAEVTSLSRAFDQETYTNIFEKLSVLQVVIQNLNQSYIESKEENQTSLPKVVKDLMQTLEGIHSSFQEKSRLELELLARQKALLLAQIDKFNRAFESQKTARERLLEALSDKSDYLISGLINKDTKNEVEKIMQWLKTDFPLARDKWMQLRADAVQQAIELNALLQAPHEPIPDEQKIIRDVNALRVVERGPFLKEKDRIERECQALLVLLEKREKNAAIAQAVKDFKLTKTACGEKEKAILDNLEALKKSLQGERLGTEEELDVYEYINQGIKIERQALADLIQKAAGEAKTLLLLLNESHDVVKEEKEIRELANGIITIASISPEDPTGTISPKYQELRALYSQARQKLSAQPVPSISTPVETPASSASLERAESAYHLEVKIQQELTALERRINNLTPNTERKKYIEISNKLASIVQISRQQLPYTDPLMHRLEKVRQAFERADWSYQEEQEKRNQVLSQLSQQPPAAAPASVPTSVRPPVPPQLARLAIPATPATPAGAASSASTQTGGSVKPIQTEQPASAASAAYPLPSQPKTKDQIIEEILNNIFLKYLAEKNLDEKQTASIQKKLRKTFKPLSTIKFIYDVNSYSDNLKLVQNAFARVIKNIKPLRRKLIRKMTTPLENEPDDLIADTFKQLFKELSKVHESFGDVFRDYATALEARDVLIKANCVADIPELAYKLLGREKPGVASQPGSTVGAAAAEGDAQLDASEGANTIVESGVTGRNVSVRAVGRGTVMHIRGGVFAGKVAKQLQTEQLQTPPSSSTRKPR